MKASFLTLGCKVNFYETEKIMAKLQEYGFEIVDNTEASDVYIINTCTVTNMAGRKSRQMIHRGKKKNKDCLVVAMGCYVDSDRETLSKDPDIDLLFSNQDKDTVAEKIMEALKDRLERSTEPKELSDPFVHTRTRAFLKVQDGCNQFCSYCIIPYVRGRLHSRPIDEVRQEVQGLAAHGYREIVVTGIHVSSYGVDFTEEKNFVKLHGKYLLDLLEAIAEVPEVARIRLGSLEPRIITKEFLDRLVKNEKICPHFHLSLQSGCDETLQRMNRHYTAVEYAQKCELLREYYDQPAITTDVIVGFPAETEEEFATTLQYVEDIALSDIHVFKYSVRHGTKAERMDHQVPEDIKNLRSNRLMEVRDRLLKAYEDKFVGTRQQILFEEWVEEDGKKYLVGHNERYVKVGVLEDEAAEKGYVENQIYEVEVRKVMKK